MELTNRISPTKWNYWRIVLALAAKDIVDAIKNKTTLTVLLGLGLMIITVQVMPLLMMFDDRPTVAIYDAARSGLADELRRDRALKISETRTAEQARDRAVEGGSSTLAVSLPQDWENSDGAIEAQGFVAHWVKPAAAEELVREAEMAIAQATGRVVDIRASIAYPTMENRGHLIMVASGLVLATILITGILVPYLILEEKVNHTLEVLQVSPVSIGQLLLGKGMAGFVYGVLAAVLLLVFNLAMVNQWGIMAAAILAIILFGVGLGLFVGTMAKNEGTVQMWVGLLAVFLMFPLILGFASSSKLPDWLEQILAWLPTSAAFELIRISFTNSSPAAEVWPKVTAVLIAVVLVFAAAGWRLRQWQA